MRKSFSKSRSAQTRRHFFFRSATTKVLVAVACLVATFAFAFLFDLETSWGATTLRIPGGGQILIDAGQLEGDFQAGRRRLILNNGVKIIFNEQVLTCDRATVDESTQTLEAIGNVVMSSPQAYIEGDSATLNYQNNTGVIVNGFVKSGQVVFEGRVVKKTGPDTYDAEKASFTACTTCPTAWTFRGSRIRAQIGGYAHINYPVLEIGGFPVLPLGYLIVPLKSERQSGLLIPFFDFGGNNGFTIGNQYFWAISRSQDATFTLKHYELRGVKALVNHRYVLSETSLGELTFGGLRDRFFEGDMRRLGIENPPQYRWFMNYDHSFDLPEGFVQKTHLALASDLHYPRDFPYEMTGIGDPSLENRVSLTKNWEKSHVSVDALYFLNQLKENPLEGNRDAVHRLPEMRYALVDRPLGKSGLLANMNFNYVNFARDEFAYDDVIADVDPSTGQPRNRRVDPTRRQSGDPAGTPGTTGTGGQFDPGLDIVRAGQRFDLQPELAYPIRLFEHVDVLPSVQFRHTQYSFNVTPPPTAEFNPTPYRQFVRGRIAARVRFSNVYGVAPVPAVQPKADLTNWVDNESSGSTELVAPRPVAPLPTLYKHEIEPEFSVSGIRLRQSENSPFFGEANRVPAVFDTQPISNSDLNSTRGLQFDYEDRLTFRNTLTGSVVNRLVRKTWSGGTPVYRQVGLLRIGQSFDIDESNKNGANEPSFKWSDISMLLDMRFDRFETNTILRYFPYHNVTNAASRVKVNDDRGRFVQATFTRNYLVTQNLNESNLPPTDDFGLSAGFDTRFFTFAGAINFGPDVPAGTLDLDVSRFAVKSWSTQLLVRPPGNCWGLRLDLTAIIGQQPLPRVSFEYNFGGET